MRHLVTQSLIQRFTEAACPEPNTINARLAVRLTLPWPPSLNRIWRVVNSKICLSLNARRFKKAVINALPKGPVIPALTERLGVHLVLCPPANIADSAWDIANREKLICDTLTQQKLWVDDSQIDYISIARGKPFATGRAFIWIYAYHPGTDTCQPQHKDTP